MTARVSIERIKAVVAADYGIPLKAIDTYRRFKAYALPRQVAMYLGCSLTEQSFPGIARRFANRDHTTVYHAFRKVAELRSVDRDLDQRLLRLECDLRQPRPRDPALVPDRPAVRPAPNRPAADAPQDRRVSIPTKHQGGKS